ncbi:MAG: DNA polymerase [Desulfomonilaceae bacterium]
MIGVSWGSLESSTCVCLPLSELPSFSQSLFNLKDSQIYVHAFKEIIKWFAYRKVEIASDRFLDVSIAACLLNPPESDRGEDYRKFMLKSLIWDYLGETYPFLPSEIQEHGRPEAIYHRLRQDASYAWALGDRLWLELFAGGNLEDLWLDVEMPLIPIFAEMELVGVGLHQEWISRARWGVETASLQICQELEKVYGKTFNPFSDDEVKDFLRKVCGKRLSPSEAINDDMLKGLSRKDPVVRKLWIWRKLYRALEFFKAVDEKDRCYPTWWMTRASVGRIICTYPPLQSVPRIFRNFLSPGKGNVFLKADFSAFQLRLLAHLSGDPALTEIFLKGGDPHTETMKRLQARGIPISRNDAKVINFSICYDGTAWSLKDNLGVPLAEAYKIMKELKLVYPSIVPFLDSVVAEVEKRNPPECYVESMFGRRRWFNEERALTAREKRQIRNAVVQMLEVDVFKQTVLAVQDAIKGKGLPVRIAMLLHDSIWFTCPIEAEMVRRAKEVIQEVMEKTVKLNVPLKVEWD